MRRQTFAVGLAAMTRAAGGGMLATALVVYVGRDGDPLAVSMLSTAFFFSMMVCTPVWGALGDLTGRRRSLLLLAGGLTTLATLGFLVVDSTWGLIGLRGLYAAFAVGFGPLMLTIVGAIAGPDRRGRASGFLSSSLAAGDMAGQAAVGFLLGLVAPSQLYALVAALALAATVAVAFVEDAGPPAANGGSVAGADADDPLTPGALLRGVRERLVPDADQRATIREFGLGPLYASLALRHVAVKGIGSLVPLFLIARLGVSEPVMGLLLTVSSGGQILFMTLFGRQADARSRKALVVGGMTVSGLYGVLLAVATVPGSVTLRIALAAAGFVAIAAGFSAMDIGTITLVSETVPPSHESEFVALRSTASGIGGVVGPTLVGTTVLLANYRVAFLLAGSLAFLAAAWAARTVVEPDRSGPGEAAPSVETALGVPHPTSADDDR
jgi:MFS family permease